MSELSALEQHRNFVANRTRRPKDWACNLAERTGTYIPGDIAKDAWCLPILQRLVERVEELEKKLGEQA